MYFIKKKKTNKINNYFQVGLGCTAVHAMDMFRSDFYVVSGWYSQNSVTWLLTCQELSVVILQCAGFL